ncbi:putative carbonic anhydrase YvdA [Pullulanibacillus camelliae]|uniref:carbonic anhydrase n=1 Tax=Pullulanibacillus camelliae TaxID=1707096 RepID=A0A8J2YG72_9BACL|nr:carbonic anhydrase [Pullulanibacillus camelliae]GGE37156.1 putative carbonic anhydrase YvdA [Pullulanibacillus camelliae]
MAVVEDILKFNEQFVNNKGYEPYLANVLPKKKLGIVTCMDSRLIELLPQALNIKNGDAKVIKTAGAIIRDPYDSVMKSLLVAIYQLTVEEVLIIGHHGCGMDGLHGKTVLENAEKRGVKASTLSKSPEELGHWLSGFESVEESVAQSVDIVRHHPLLPENILVHGLVISPETGKLDVVSLDQQEV